MKISSMLKRYADMSGDKKVRIGLSLSETVRRVRQAGINAINKPHEKRSRATS